MGNVQVNSTFTPKNYSNITNSTGKQVFPTTLAPYRPALSREEVMAQMEAIASISALTFFINLGMVIFTSVRLKAVPYMFIKNFMVIDIINAVVTSGPWISGVFLDFLGKSWLISARLPVVSNIGDSSEIYPRSRENPLPREDMSYCVSILEISRTPVYFTIPLLPSPKLETTCSLCQSLFFLYGKRLSGFF